jgi:hypothetical protein
MDVFAEVKSEAGNQLEPFTPDHESAVFERIVRWAWLDAAGSQVE